MKAIFLSFLLLAGACARSQNEYKLVNTYHIPSPGWWDYIAINHGKLYVSHGSQVNILNESTGDSAGVIPHTNGVHGIAFDNELGRGYTSNGRANNVTVFDLKTNDSLTTVATGENPDAIMFEPYTKTIITCNGRSKTLSVIDPKTNSVIATIDVGGKPETAASDSKGTLYVNIEDKNEIAVIDLKKHAVTANWPLSADGPTGLVYDKSTMRLFAGCDNYLVVVNAENGKIIDKLPIGQGCDGVAFDPKRKMIFTSNGQSGTITAIKENSADNFVVLGNYSSKKGARTITIDEETGRLFLPAAEFDTANMQNGRPRVIPGSFQVLVFAKQ